MIDLEEVYFEAGRRGIWVVEDVAQCYRATCNGFGPGRFSDAVCLSFDPTKPLGAYIGGGAVLSNKENLISKVKQLRCHGQNESGVYELMGYNSQMASGMISSAI